MTSIAIIWSFQIKLPEQFVHHPEIFLLPVPWNAAMWIFWQRKDWSCVGVIRIVLPFKQFAALSISCNIFFLILPCQTILMEYWSDGKSLLFSFWTISFHLDALIFSKANLKEITLPWQVVFLRVGVCLQRWIKIFCNQASFWGYKACLVITGLKLSVSTCLCQIRLSGL